MEFIVSYLKALLITSFVLTFSSYAFARSPDVDQMIEVDLEAHKPKEGHPGFDFNQAESQFKRTPANITTNHKHSPASDYLIPFLILTVIPFMIWILISKQNKVTKQLKDAYEIADKGEKKLLELTKEDDDSEFPKAS